MKHEILQEHNNEECKMCRKEVDDLNSKGLIGPMTIVPLHKKDLTI
jgi:hypothetical protein